MSKPPEVAPKTEIFVDEQFGDVIIKQCTAADQSQVITLSIYDVPVVIFALKNLLREGRDITHALDREMELFRFMSERRRDQSVSFADDDSLPF